MQISKKLSRSFKRPQHNIYTKLLKLKNANVQVKKTTKTRVVKKEETPSITSTLIMPEGMVFEGSAKRIELHFDHFRVYF